MTFTPSKMTRLNEIELQILSDHLKAKSIGINQVRDTIIDYHTRGLFRLDPLLLSLSFFLRHFHLTNEIDHKQPPCGPDCTPDR